MRTLVAYASKHGSTREIAERIGSILGEAGVDVDVTEVSKVRHPEAYGAVVVCSAVYYGHWLKAAADFVRSHADHLATCEVWLCSSGPLGTKPTPEASDIVEFRRTIAPLDHVSLAGALDRTTLSFAERVIVKGVHAPDGDFRDWTAIDAWASGIAEQLNAGVVNADTASGAREVRTTELPVTP